MRYSRADQIVPRDRWTSEVNDNRPVDTLLYTTSVVNTPSRIDIDIRMAREKAMSIVLDPIRREATTVLEEIRLKDEKSRREIMDKPGCSPCDRPAVEKRIACFPQFYSRIGFVHEFRPLDASQVQQLLGQRWTFQRRASPWLSNLGR